MYFVQIAEVVMLLKLPLIVHMAIMAIYVMTVKLYLVINQPP